MSLKKEWIITQEAFDRLLSCLDTDREQAGRKYERIHLKLVKYFEWRGGTLPDSEADETINRVARRIEEGVEIYNLNAYIYGVARLVLTESRKAREKEEAALGQMPTVEMSAMENDDDAVRRRDCFDRCLQQLPGETREIIIMYYQEEKGMKIESRKRLASRLGIPLNALRIRAHRIRTGLEACIRECLGQEV